jgi:hypothetical protein
MNNLLQNYKTIFEKLMATCSHIESFSQIRQSNKTFCSARLQSTQPDRILEVKMPKT